MVDYSIEIIDEQVYIYLEDGVTLRIISHVNDGLSVDYQIMKSEWKPVPDIITRYKDTIPR